MSGKAKPSGNPHQMPKPMKRAPKVKMTYNKRLMSMMKNRLKRFPGSR